MWPIESIGSEFQGKRRREPFSMSPHLTLEISFDKERPLLPSIHGFEFLHGGGGFSEVAMGPGRNLRPSRIGRGAHLRLPHRDEFRCQRDAFATLGFSSFIRKLRPVENGGDKARPGKLEPKTEPNRVWMEKPKGKADAKWAVGPSQADMRHWENSNEPETSSNLRGLGGDVEESR